MDLKSKARCLGADKGLIVCKAVYKAAYDSLELGSGKEPAQSAGQHEPIEGACGCFGNDPFPTAR